MCPAVCIDCYNAPEELEIVIGGPLRTRDGASFPCDYAGVYVVRRYGPVQDGSGLHDCYNYSYTSGWFSLTVYLSSGRLTVAIHDHTYLQIAWRTAAFTLPMDCDHDNLDVPYWGVGTDWGTGGNYCLPSPDATCTINRVIQ